MGKQIKLDFLAITSVTLKKNVRRSLSLFRRIDLLPMNFGVYDMRSELEVKKVCVCSSCLVVAQFHWTLLLLGAVVWRALISLSALASQMQNMCT